MKLLHRAWSILIIAVRRILAQRGMSLAIWLGITVAISLTMSIPLYSNSAYQIILNKNLWKTTPGSTKYKTPSPFTYVFRYLGSQFGDIKPLTPEQYRRADAYFSSQASRDLGLPAKSLTKFMETQNFRLFPDESAAYKKVGALDWLSFTTLSGYENHITLVEGNLPEPASADPNAPVEVLIHEKTAIRLGIQAGEVFIAYIQQEKDPNKTPVQFPIRITGIWVATDPEEDFWFYSSESFEKRFLVPEATVLDRVVPAIRDQLDVAIWYWVMDGSGLQAEQVPALLSRMYATRDRAATVLPGLKMDVSPEAVLVQFKRSAEALTLYLYAFSVPLYLMIMIFIILVVGMVVDQRKNEIAVLRSRGSSISQLLGIALLESFLLGVLGLITAIPLSLMIATFFSRTVSFLNFSGASQMHASFSWLTLRFGLASLALVTVAQVLPTLGAARNTVITYKRERARDLKRPWWQRAWLDLLLLIPAAYGFYLMKQQGGLVVLGRGSQTGSGDPFQDPLLLLVPTMGSYAITLLLLRILPYLMSIIAWIASKTNSVGTLMAARYLSRSAREYNAPLILLVLTLSLSTFTASLAQTLDRHIHDQAYYQVGSEISVKEIGELVGGGQISQTAPGQSSQPEETASQDAYWVFMPVTDHLRVPGVKAAARVERVRIAVTNPAPEVDAEFIGVDRADFAQVAFWREDFSQVPLGELMNRLAIDPAGVLISKDLQNSHNLQVGDTIQVAASVGSTPYRIIYNIVGVFDLFPTWKPSENPLVVGNLDYYFEQVGGEQPYLVWLKTDAQTDSAAVVAGVNNIYQRLMYVQITRDMLNAELERPERQGFFGLLSVGFIALGLLTVLGFLLYAITSFRRRFIEFSLLRAIGLSAVQMAILLSSELAFLFLFGMGAGTLLGVWVSNWFIPALQVGNIIAVNLPPFLVTIDWPSVFQNYILFSLLFFVSLAILIVSMIRMKVFQAIKMGEST